MGAKSGDFRSSKFLLRSMSQLVRKRGFLSQKGADKPVFAQAPQIVAAYFQRKQKQLPVLEGSISVWEPWGFRQTPGSISSRIKSKRGTHTHTHKDPKTIAFPLLGQKKKCIYIYT